MTLRRRHEVHEVYHVSALNSCIQAVQLRQPDGLQLCSGQATSTRWRKLGIWRNVSRSFSYGWVDGAPRRILASAVDGNAPAAASNVLRLLGPLHVLLIQLANGLAEQRAFRRQSGETAATDCWGTSTASPGAPLICVIPGA
jgi:hypothetical protein